MSKIHAQPQRNDRYGGTVLTLRLGRDLHAVPVESVEELLPALPVESVPQCPCFVRGVVFVRGHLIPVLDAAERLGMQNHERPAEPHIVCLRLGERIVGVEFDEALDLIELEGADSLDASTFGVGTGFFAGMIEYKGQIIRMLDPQRLLAEEEAAELERG
jgi:purine-binding chemotaxis protein CheW